MTEDLIHGGGQEQGGNEGSWRQRTYLKRLKKKIWKVKLNADMINQ